MFAVIDHLLENMTYKLSARALLRQWVSHYGVPDDMANK